MTSFQTSRASLDRYLRKISKTVPIGCMSPAAIASPMLSEYQGLWLITVSIFLISTTVFVSGYLEEMKTYGQFTLPVATILTFAACASARAPLADLVPFIPVAVWLFVLLTVYCLPKVHGLLTRPINLQELAEEGRHYSFQEFPMDFARTQQHGRTRPGNGSTNMNEWLRGMDRRSVSGLLDDLSTHESDIELPMQSEADAIAWRRAVSMGRAGFLPDGISQTSSDVPYPRSLSAAVHDGHFQNSEDRFDSPSLSPTAISDPSMAESGTPLLG